MMKQKGVRVGASILNAVLALLIIGGLISGAVYQSGWMLSQNETREEVDALHFLAHQASQLKSKDGYENTLTETLVRMGMLPLLLGGNTSTGKISNQWGGDVTLVSLDSGANFGINYSNMPKRVCLGVAGEVKSGVLFSMGKGTAQSVGGSALSIDDATPEEINEMCSHSGPSRIVFFSTRSP